MAKPPMIIFTWSSERAKELREALGADFAITATSRNGDVEAAIARLREPGAVVVATLLKMASGWRGPSDLIVFFDPETIGRPIEYLRQAEARRPIAFGFRE